jgi:hypothetical protein
MSRIDDELQFAPGIPFTALDFRYGKLPKQFYRRIVGFYLSPAVELANRRHDFAAGLLAVCAADALAGFITGASGTTERMVGFFRQIDGLGDEEVARLFVDHFRNGLVHEARVKSGGEFSLTAERVAQRRGASLAVNPALLANAVHARLEVFRQQLEKTPADLNALKKKIRSRFSAELKG